MKEDIRMEVIEASIYDHPEYYDLVFGSDCDAELEFIQEINAIYLDSKARRLFEPACGTGRLITRLAELGFEVSGVDLNPKAVAFCNSRFEELGYDSRAFVGDMSQFVISDEPYELAFNTINSFRHLREHDQAVAHLRCMANAIVPNGIYLVGINLTPTTIEPLDEEEWFAAEDSISVDTFMWTVERNPERRLERFGIRFDISTPERKFRIEDELQMRSYTDVQFEELVRDSECWEMEATYDFTYDIEFPIEVDSATEDVVYVLRRK
ncbi:MAG: class I SAM-dependent methyltransferase [Pirellulaceae bacterium]